MLSDDAQDLADLLRSHVGPDVKGIGPDVGRLVELWGDRGHAELEAKGRSV